MMLHYLLGIPLWLIGKDTNFPPTQGTQVSLIFLIDSFLGLRLFSSPACTDQHSAENLSGILCRPLEFALHAVLSSPILCSMNSIVFLVSYLILLKSGSPQAHMDSSLHRSLETVKALSWINCRANLICSPFLKSLSFVNCYPAS